MPKLHEIVNATNLQDYTYEIPVDNGVIDALFPETKQEALTLEYIKGGEGLPVVASVHSWDAETEIGDREAFEIMSMELAQVRRKLKLSAKDAMVIETPRNDRELTEKIAKVFDDANNLVKAVRTRYIAMAFEALTTGKLTFDENGYQGTLDYKLPSAHTSTPSTKWSTASAKPMDDIRAWQDVVEASTGTRPTRALTSRKVANTLQNNASIRSAIYGANSDRLVSFAVLNSFFAEQGLPQLQVVEGKYRKRVLKNGKYVNETIRYVPEDTFVLLPDGILGHRVFGPTPEELVLRQTNEVNDAKIGNIVVDTYVTDDPVARWVRASAMGLPSFPAADKVYIATKVVAS